LVQEAILAGVAKLELFVETSGAMDDEAPLCSREDHGVVADGVESKLVKTSRCVGILGLLVVVLLLVPHKPIGSLVRGSILPLSSFDEDKTEDMPTYDYDIENFDQSLIKGDGSVASKKYVSGRTKTCASVKPKGWQWTHGYARYAIMPSLWDGGVYNYSLFWSCKVEFHGKSGSYVNLVNAAASAYINVGYRLDVSASSGDPVMILDEAGNKRDVRFPVKFTTKKRKLSDGKWDNGILEKTETEVRWGYVNGDCTWGWSLAEMWDH